MEIENKYLKEPWRRLYDVLGIPETIKVPEMTYTEYNLDKQVKKFPNALAAVQYDYEITYKELKDHVDRLATALVNLGVKKGDIIATVLTTSIQHIICDLAIPEIGAVHLLASPIDSVDRLVDVFTRTKTNVVICTHTNVKDGDVIGKIKEVAKKYPLEKIIVTKTRDYSSKVPEHEKEEGIIWLTDLIEKYPPNPPKVDINPKKDLAMLLFTGGSTGVPKGVMISHRNAVAMVNGNMPSMLPPAINELLMEMGGSASVMVALPLFHAHGQAMVRIVLSMGNAVLLTPDPRDMKEFIRLARKYHPIMNLGIPTQFMKLLREKGAEDLGMIAVTGSMALAPKVQRDFEEKTGSIVGEGYGMSETNSATHVPSTADIVGMFFGGNLDFTKKLFHLINKILMTPGVLPLLKMVVRMTAPLSDPKVTGKILNKVISFMASNIVSTSTVRRGELTGSIGMKRPDIKVKIVDGDTGETIPMEKVVKEKLRGEMCLKGPQVMLGYWPELGSGLDEEGYVHSGDVVRVDEWGRMYIVDRVKDMANVSGYKVYTKEMDDLLYEYPGVNEAAVIGVPDPERPGSERLKAFVALFPEYKGKIKEEDIIEFFKERVSPYAVPKSVEFRDTLPKIADKIFKRRLREEELKKTGK